MLGKSWGFQLSMMHGLMFDVMTDRGPNWSKLGSTKPGRSLGRHAGTIGCYAWNHLRGTRAHAEVMEGKMMLQLFSSSNTAYWKVQLVNDTGRVHM